MRLAVVSDIHANRHAYEAVLEDIARHEAEEMWCLGDVVGYGAEPNACVELTREFAAIALAGNHDLAVCSELSIEEFSPGASLAVRWTQERIRPENAAYLLSLKPQNTDEVVGLFHASPRDPVWEYVLSALQAEICLDEQEHRISLVGHSHVALAFSRVEGEPATGDTRPGGTELDISTGEWILNPGSVGQPRDGDPRAAWLLLDTENWTASWNRTEYDVSGASAAIRSAGLPESLAERLSYGE